VVVWASNHESSIVSWALRFRQLQWFLGQCGCPPAGSSPANERQRRFGRSRHDPANLRRWRSLVGAAGLDHNGLGRSLRKMGRDCGKSKTVRTSPVAATLATTLQHLRRQCPAPFDVSHRSRCGRFSYEVAWLDATCTKYRTAQYFGIAGGVRIPGVMTLPRPRQTTSLWWRMWDEPRVPSECFLGCLPARAPEISDREAGKGPSGGILFLCPAEVRSPATRANLVHATGCVVQPGPVRCVYRKWLRRNE
jgi:hypothetical protein